MTHTVHRDDVVAWLRGREWLAQNGHAPRYHAVLCDPPYFLGSIVKRFGAAGAAEASTPIGQRMARGFMGQTWDGFESPWHYQAWVTEWGRLLLSHVYPGAVLLAFGGTRTYHRLAAGLEDAGWEVADCLMYMYGSGFPKSHDISKALDREAGAEREVMGVVSGMGKQNPEWNGTAKGRTENYFKPEYNLTAPATPDAHRWQGYGTALKPAFEPVVLARAPRAPHTYAALARMFGTGALNVDGARVNLNGAPKTSGGCAGTTALHGGGITLRAKEDNALGRWPANVILDEHAAAALDAMSGELTSGTGAVKQATSTGWQGSCYGKESRPAGTPNIEYGDSGGASRFFYTAKASAWEREAGLGAWQQTTVNDGRQTPIDNAYQRGETQRRNVHPTVKPIALTEYLARLILPPALDEPRRLLVPFAGSGSEMIGALLAGWDVVTGIEQSPEYVALAEARLAWWARFGSYEQARAAWDAEQGEQAQREAERAAGVEQLSLAFANEGETI